MPTKDFVFWGASGHAKVLADLINLQGYHLVGLFDNNPNCNSPWPEIPIYIGYSGFSTWLERISEMELPMAAVAIGGSRGIDRCQISNELISAGLILPPLIHPKSIVAPSAFIADGCHILAGSVVGSEARLGRCVIINTSASVDHECILREGVHIAPGAILCGCIEVGAFSFIGPGTIITPHIRIGENTVIGAGSVVTRDIPDNVIAWGTPARIIRENRNE
jgi:sugar O-acyltransferase (sialic acid O-acetyltransferase NeuD family)